MDLKASDFQKLKYPCFETESGKDLLEVFPELKRYPEFSSNEHSLDNNKVLRYIIYLYDKQTPLSSEKNLIKRKMLSAELAGFEMVDKKYPELIEQAISGRNIYVNRMACVYVRNQRDIQYASLITGLSMFYDNLAQLSKPATAEDDMESLNRKATLFNHTMKMISTLEETAVETFSGDTQLMYEADEMEREEQKKIQSYPEHIAMLQDTGQLPKDFAKIKKEIGL